MIAVILSGNVSASVNPLSAYPVSVNCIIAEWNACEGCDYELSVTPADESTGYTENIFIRFEGNSKAYITGLREGSEYEITVRRLDGKQESSIRICTETVETIETFEHEEGCTGCFAYEHAGGLTLEPSRSAIAGCHADDITGTGIMRNEYGDYCAAMGTVYGYCGDRFLVELENGVQFTVRICDSKGDVAYHDFGDGGKCVIEFIYADGCLPDCAAFTGNYGSFRWDGLAFDNIREIRKIN